MLELNQIYNIDCLEGMKLIADKSIDMIFVDLPYGVTAQNKWDSVIPFEPLWKRSGSIPLAAKLEGRNYIGMDNGACEKKNSEYFGKPWAEIAKMRISNNGI